VTQARPARLDRPIPLADIAYTMRRCRWLDATKSARKMLGQDHRQWSRCQRKSFPGQ